VAENRWAMEDLALFSKEFRYLSCRRFRGFHYHQVPLHRQVCDRTCLVSQLTSETRHRLIVYQPVRLAKQDSAVNFNLIQTPKGRALGATHLTQIPQADIS
jgi:hypothetical protein